jgi:hypothetical protein
MTDDSQVKVKEALMQVFDRLSTERKVEVLEFALFMRARERQESFAKSAGIEDVTSQLRPDSSPSAHPLHGSVLHYDDPFSPVAIADWEVLQ